MESKGFSQTPFEPEHGMKQYSDIERRGCQSMFKKKLLINSTERADPTIEDDVVPHVCLPVDQGDDCIQVRIESL